MSQFTTDNIYALAAWPMGLPRGWRITFQSDNAGMCHQLYVNGRLADWTDSPAQRSFVLDAADHPRRIVVAAVEPGQAGSDLSAMLLLQAGVPQWIYRRKFIRSRQLPIGSKVEIVGDRATGVMDERPLAAVEVWPEWDAATSDGYGFGGVGDTNSGLGAFGAGEFGIDHAVLEIQTTLREEGTHRLAMRTVLPDGSRSAAIEESVEVRLPPPPPKSISVSGYDCPSHTLTLQIQ